MVSHMGTRLWFAREFCKSRTGERWVLRWNYAVWRFYQYFWSGGIEVSIPHSKFRGKHDRLPRQTSSYQPSVFRDYRCREYSYWSSLIISYSVVYENVIQKENRICCSYLNIDPCPLSDWLVSRETICAEAMRCRLENMWWDSCPSRINADHNECVFYRLHQLRAHAFARDHDRVFFWWTFHPAGVCVVAIRR